jgi:hypothetical protein
LYARLPSAITSLFQAHLRATQGRAQAPGCRETPSNGRPGSPLASCTRCSHKEVRVVSTDNYLGLFVRSFAHLSPSIHCSNALEELSVRAGIALVQKKVMHDIISEGDVDDDFDREYTALSAQVVSLCHGLKRLGRSPCCMYSWPR